MQNLKGRNFWLLKSEPDTFSIEDLEKVKVEPWTGVRNYQARNTMRDLMRVGDLCFFYHSSCEIPGIVGLCSVCEVKVVDTTQFEKSSPYFDPKSKRENPTWICVKVKFEKKFKENISLTKLKSIRGLEKMLLLQKGSRLSVQPVWEKEFKQILKLAQ